MNINTAPAMIVLAFLAAIAATILAFIFIIPEKKREKLNKFGKFIQDVCNFKFLIIEKIMQALYVFSTALCISCGFFMLFSFSSYNSYFGGSYTQWYGGYGLLLLILGPIVVRLVYEGLMLFLILIKNVIQINTKIATNEENSQDPFAVPNIKEVINEDK